MTEKELRVKVKQVRDEYVEKLNYNVSSPDELGRGISAAHLVCHTIKALVLDAQSSITIDGNVVGLKMPPGSIHGLTATNRPALSMLIGRLADEVVGDFRKEVEEHWRQAKIDSGLVRDKPMTAAEKFTSQEFQGFD